MMERQMQLFAELHAEAAGRGPRARHDHAGVTSYYDVPYAAVPGYRPLVLDLHAALTAAGADSTLVTLPGALHEDRAFWTDATIERMAAFLEHSLRPSYTSA